MARKGRQSATNVLLSRDNTRPCLFISYGHLNTKLWKLLPELLDLSQDICMELLSTKA